MTDTKPNNPPTYDDELLTQLTPEQAEILSEDITVQTPDGEATVSEVMLDIIIMHMDLSDYRRAALSMTQRLKERRLEAEDEGDDVVASIVGELEESAHGAYLRCQHGDAELLGDADGEHSGYFDFDGGQDGTS